MVKSTTIVPPPSDEPTTGGPDRACPQPREWYPFGVIVAAHWVAHQSEPSPDSLSFIEAVNMGLIELTDPWKVTERGRAALHDRGWL